MSLKDITRLVMCQPTAFDMIGIICKLYLDVMIDSSFELHLFLLTKG